MTKICFTPLLTCLQGCQKIWMTKLKSILVSWSTKIQPKLKKLWKTVKIAQRLSNKPYFPKVFLILSSFGWILALHFTKVVFNLVFQICWHPWHPWGCVNSEDIIVLRSVSDIFVLKRHLAIFSIIYDLTLDITCIDLTSFLRSYNGYIYNWCQPLASVGS